MIGVWVMIMFLPALLPSGTTPTVTISATTSTSIDIGQSVSFRATVTGGTPPYTITWCPLGGSGMSVSILFSNGGSYGVYAVVVDDAGRISANSNTIQVTVSEPTLMSKRAIFLKERTQENTVQPHDWDAIADVFHVYGVNMAIVEIANQDYFFGEAQLPAIIAAFHAQNIEVHVLMKAPYITSNPNLWQLDTRRNPVTSDISADDLRCWTCPTNPTSIIQALPIINGILDYDINGFMFDYIRYNDLSRDCCFCDYCKTAFESYLGHTITDAEWVLNGPFEANRLVWRTQPINVWVQTVSVYIKAVKPSVAVSAAVFHGTSTWDPKVEVGQDGYYWVQQGYLDFIAPMVYIEYMQPPMDINVFRTYAQWVRDRYAPYREVPMVFFIETEAEQTVSVDLFAQTYQVIQESGIDADGFAIFRYGGLGWTDALDIRPYLDSITTSFPRAYKEHYG